ncbi:MAG: hypothetical protein Q7S18_03645 [bacterium]|nr:hypothetical protein [bacterium]
MKKIIIIISIAIAIPSLLFLFLFLKNRNNVPVEKGKIIIPAGNKQLPIADYSQNAKRIIDDKDIVIDETEEYDILGFSYNNQRSFLISIKSSDNLEETRKKAENELLSKLEISGEDACLLDVSVNVSKDIDENLAGRNFGLSFCPNGKPFK